MNLLLDTHVLLWAAGAPEKLSKAAREMLEDGGAVLWFSAASIWEVAIKSSLGREDFRAEPRRLRRGLLDNGWRELAISSEHAAATVNLPPLHRDPFDRILVAQAQVEGLTLVTADELVAQYDRGIRRV
ncbi:MAG TPA: type II toxin-antitoxin system VapC family toxin [Caulobacterales bacterium]|jgi:PIN domain nuclease of toxin-antitoxin system|nr:type II toxin-antitoxin system VapC family toxin [Caulobacterales bacterium]